MAAKPGRLRGSLETVRLDGKARPIETCAALGEKPNDAAVRVQEPYVVSLVVNHRMIAPSGWETGPENGSDRAAFREDGAAVLVVSRSCGEREVIVRGPVVGCQKLEQTAEILRVVEKSDVPERRL